MREGKNEQSEAESEGDGAAEKAPSGAAVDLYGEDHEGDDNAAAPGDSAKDGKPQETEAAGAEGEGSNGEDEKDAHGRKADRVRKSIVSTATWTEADFQ